VHLEFFVCAKPNFTTEAHRGLYGGAQRRTQDSET
jgi:hypothetical protein